jgi:hypothetical protein
MSEILQEIKQRYLNETTELDGNQLAATFRADVGFLLNQLEAENVRLGFAIGWQDAKASQQVDESAMVKLMLEACEGLEDLEDCMVAALNAITKFLELRK